jgi:hypothetical protein
VARIRSEVLALFKITAYQEWQIEAEVMVDKKGFQDQVQGVGTVQNNSLPGVAGCE